MKKIGVLLAGCGVYDGSEIQEAVFTLLAINDAGAEAICFAPNRDQHHVVNHLNGTEMTETRNVLTESARIARGKIQDLAQINISDYDALVIPGGFGAAKNLNQWALAGPDGKIYPQVKELITATIKAGKPVCGLCMGPTVIAKALEGSGIQASLTVGSKNQPSPYDIQGISSGMESLGMKAEMKTINEFCMDAQHKIVTAPCYMMEASISEVYQNVKTAVQETINMI